MTTINKAFELKNHLVSLKPFIEKLLNCNHFQIYFARFDLCVKLSHGGRTLIVYIIKYISLKKYESNLLNLDISFDIYCTIVENRKNNN